MRDLTESREAIRKVDEQMAALFVQRMEAVRDVARFKHEHAMPVEDKEQEARVLAERGSLVEDDELRPFYKAFLQHTMDVSKDWQRHLMNNSHVAR